MFTKGQSVIEKAGPIRYAFTVTLVGKADYRLMRNADKKRVRMSKVDAESMFEPWHR